MAGCLAGRACSAPPEVTALFTGPGTSPRIPALTSRASAPRCAPGWHRQRRGRPAGGGGGCTGTAGGSCASCTVDATHAAAAGSADSADSPLPSLRRQLLPAHTSAASENLKRSKLESMAAPRLPSAYEYSPRAPLLLYGWPQPNSASGSVCALSGCRMADLQRTRQRHGIAAAAVVVARGVRSRTRPAPHLVHATLRARDASPYG